MIFNIWNRLYRADRADLKKKRKLGEIQTMTTDEKIQKILYEKVNTKLALHNGSAGLSGIENGTAKIKFYGACASCMASSDTFDGVVKKEILSACPELTDVVIDDATSWDLLEMARKILNKESDA